MAMALRTAGGRWQGATAVLLARAGGQPLSWGADSQCRRLRSSQAAPTPDPASVALEVDAEGFATVTLTRPDKFNAFSDTMIARCTEVFDELRRSRPRAAFVRAQGKFFCAGADLGWMRRTAGYSPEENVLDAVRLGQMLANLNTLPCPTVALVQGPAFGGGVGLTSCCDVAVAVDKATFTLSEAKLGLIPATISPYVVARIGTPQARRYFLTAEQISAVRAKEIGLVHEVVSSAEELDAFEQRMREQLRLVAPSAAEAGKELITAVENQPITPALIQDTAERLANQRASAECKEGLQAFFDRRKAAWIDAAAYRAAQNGSR